MLCRKTLETQDLNILICSETLKTQDLKILIVARPWKPRTLKFGYVAKPWKPRTQNLKILMSRDLKDLGPYQTCAEVPKRFEILGSLSPRSGTLMDLGPCTSFLLWDSGNPGSQNCVMSQDPGNPGPQDSDMQ